MKFLKANAFRLSCLFLSAFLYFPSLSFSKDLHGGQIVLSLSTDPKSFNEIVSKEATTSEITDYIFEGLTRTNVFTLQVEPHLALDWQVSEGGLQWTFRLRRDVSWQDGKPFTADDVVFTFNDLIFNPEIPASARDIFTIDGEPFKVEKVDDYTVRFILPVKFAPFLRSMGHPILPKHKLEKFVQDKKFNSAWGIDTDPKEIVGTGPFKLSKYIPGQKLILERNPNYWKKSSQGDSLPYLDRIVYLLVQSADVELLKFMEGSVDLYGLRGMDYSYLKPLEGKRHFTIHDLGPAMSSNFLVFNLNPGTNPNTNKPFVDPVKLRWFSSLDFRRAVAHTVDKAKIVEIVKNGLGYPQDSAMGQGAGFFHNPNVFKYDYSLGRAKEILAGAGFIDRNQDGYLEDAEGNTVEFTLYTNADSSERVDIAGIMRHDLEQLGMKINFQGIEFNTLVGKLTSTYEWEAVVLGLTGGVEPHFGKNVWDSSGQLHMWNPKQEVPATDWEKRINDLFTEGVQELDDQKRKVIYDEFQYIVSEKLPVIYTVLSAKMMAIRNRFGNIRPSNYGGLIHNIEEIYVESKAQ